MIVYCRRPEFEDDLHPLKPPCRGNAVNKAGRLVLVRCHHNRKTHKVYEADSAEHAEFIAAVSRQQAVRENFPAISSINSQCVTSEWVTGVSVSKALRRGDTVLLAELIKIQIGLHRFNVGILPPCNYCYLNNFILPRFRRAAGLIGQADFADELCRRINLVLQSMTPILIHPDLTPDNILRASSGKLLAVDNELLSIGRTPWVDVLNTSKALGGETGQIYADMYMRMSGRRIDHEEYAVLQDIWLARCAGADYVAGRIGAMRQLFDKHRIGQYILPFMVNKK